MEEIITKICKRCLKDKDFSKFCKDKRRPSGRGSYCNLCANIKAKEWLDRGDNRAVHANAVKNYAINNPEARERHRLNSKEAKDNKQYYLKKFGISKLDYDRMFDQQNGVCAICLLPNKSGIRLSVDHDHNTGKVRGLLCHVCNMYLGRINESLDKINRMEDYLNDRLFSSP